MMNEFTEIYKNLSNRELVAITVNSGDYQPTAVETAKLELQTRNLSETLLQELQTEIASANAQKVARREKQQTQNKMLREAVAKIFGNVNFLEKGIASHERQLRILCWLFAIGAAFIFYFSFDLVLGVFQEISFGFAGLQAYLLLLTIVSLVIGAVLFWKRMLLGWILMTFYLVSLISGFVLQHFYFINKHTYSFEQRFSNIMMSDVLLATYLLYAGVFVFCYYVLCKHAVKAIFRVPRWVSVMTHLVAVGLQAALWLPLALD
jgi:hypothetical protein